MEKENALTLAYDLLRYLIPQLTKFPKTQKFVLADRIQNGATDILELLIEAYFSPPTAKRPLLQKANTGLEKLRYLVRLAKDLHFMDVRRHEYVQEQINAIGRQVVGGWLKSLP